MVLAGKYPMPTAENYQDVTAFAGKTRAELVMETRDVLDKAGKAVQAKNEEERKAKAEQAKNDAQDLKRLRAEEAQRLAESKGKPT